MVAVVVAVGRGAFLKDRWSSDNAVENPTSERQTSVVGLGFGVREPMFKSSEISITHCVMSPPLLMALFSTPVRYHLTCLFYKV